MDIAILLLCGGKMKDDVVETVGWDTWFSSMII